MNILKNNKTFFQKNTNQIKEKNPQIERKLKELLYQEEVNGEKKINIINLIFSIITLLVFIILIPISGYSKKQIYNFLGLSVFALYNIILFIILKFNIYKKYFKYFSIFVNISAVTIIIFGYSYSSGCAHTLRTCTLYIYFWIVALSGLYKRPNVPIYTCFVISIQYSILFFYAVFFTNTKIINMETFYEPAIGYDILIVFIGTIFCTGSLISYIAFRFKSTLQQALYSEANAFAKEKEKIAIEELSKQKTNFFINLTHETKTPLTLISNYLDKHIKKHGSSNEIKVIEQNLNKLKNDIINFMDAEKLERGSYMYNHDQIINLSDAINIKVMMFREIANKKNIKISSSIDDNIYIKIDPAAIDRIVNNLIDNSIKYTDNDGKINIVLKNNGNKSNLIVSDTGIGISKEHQNHIFEPYYQITHEKRNVQGIGMGLHIVKKIVEEINGKIEIESESGKGTSFKIIFNNHMLIKGEIVKENINYTKPFDNLSGIKLKDTEYDESKNTIFLIEDNINMLLYLQSNISANYNVFFAINGKEALEKLDNIPKPDLIISDIMMDVMDGMTFFEELNKNEKYGDIPFIFLTAKTSNGDKLQAITKGAIDYIYKPFNIEELMAKINSIIKVQESQKEQNIQELEKRISGALRKSNNDVKTQSFKEKCFEYHITEKELEIIKLLFDGLEVKEIGERLNIPFNTVKKRMSFIYKKCGVQNKIELFKLFN